jgi:hypothetical protein
MWIKLKEQDKWPINSSWIYEARPEQTVCMKELWDRIIQEIKSCTISGKRRLTFTRKYF